jgi:hypothetical protein
MAAAYEAVLERHERLGIPLAVWENGSVVLRTAAEIRRLMEGSSTESPEVTGCAPGKLNGLTGEPE